MRLRIARKIASRRWRKGRPLGPSETAYSPAQIWRAIEVLYRSWGRACPRRPGGWRSTGSDLRHRDWFAGNRLVSLYARWYSIRGRRRKQCAADLRHRRGA